MDTEKRIENIEESITKIKENHLAHIQDSMQSMQLDVARVTMNVDWLMKYHWITIGAALGALITGVINMVNSSH